MIEINWATEIVVHADEAALETEHWPAFEPGEIRVFHKGRQI